MTPTSARSRTGGIRRCAVALSLLAACGSGGSTTATTKPPGAPLATLDVISTAVTVQSVLTNQPSSASSGQRVTAGDTLRTDTAGFAEVGYFDGSLLRIDHDAELTIIDLKDVETGRTVHTDLRSGRAWSRITKRSESETWQLDTPVASATVRGTAFDTDCSSSLQGGCRFTVVDGTVELRLPDGTTISLEAGQQITLRAGEPSPSPETVRLDAAQTDPWIADNLSRDTAAGRPEIQPAAAGELDGTYTLASPPDGCRFGDGSLDGETLTVLGAQATITNSFGSFVGTVEVGNGDVHISADQQLAQPIPGIPAPNFDLYLHSTGPDTIAGTNTFSGVNPSGDTGWTCQGRTFTGTRGGSGATTTSTTAPTTGGALGSHPTYSTTQASGSGCTPGPGPLPDGWWWGRAVTTVGPGTAFDFDLGCYYTGAIATQLAQAAGEPEALDDVWIVNENPAVRSITLAPSAEIVCTSLAPDEIPCAQPPGGPSGRFSVWVRMEGGQATKVLEQFAP